MLETMPSRKSLRRWAACAPSSSWAMQAAARHRMPSASARARSRSASGPGRHRALTGFPKLESSFAYLALITLSLTRAVNPAAAGFGGDPLDELVGTRRDASQLRASQHRGRVGTDRGGTGLVARAENSGAVRPVE